MTTSLLKAGIGVSFYVAGLALSSSAYGATRSTLDLTAGIGASFNPSLEFSSNISAFGRFSALGTHEWRTERTTTSISAFGDNTTYLSGENGSSRVFDLRASSAHVVNPNLTVFGNLGFQGDVNGQLSNRFTRATPDLSQPPSDVPTPIIVDDPTFIGFGGRQYRLSGMVGLSMRANERANVSLSTGAQRNFASGSQSNTNFNSYFATAAYDHQFSERTSAGFSTNLQYQDYDAGFSSFVVNPLLTVSRQFSDRLSGSAAVGLLFTRQDILGGGTGTSVDPSFAFSLCRRGERGQLCGRISRDARSSLGVGFGPQANSLSISTLGSVNYSRQLDENQTIQVSVTAVRFASEVADGDKFRSSYLTFLAGYDRKIRQRLAVGVTAGGRKLFQEGSDPKADFNANAYVRYRLGDVQ